MSRKGYLKEIILKPKSIGGYLFIEMTFSWNYSQKL